MDLGVAKRSSRSIFDRLRGVPIYVWLLLIVLVPNAQLQTSAGLGLPLGWVFAALPIGSVLIILPMFRNIYRALRPLWQKPC